MDQLLLNLKLMGWFDHDLSKLVQYVRKVSRACRIPIPVNYPLSGADAFRTATGVHAAAIIKAKKRANSASWTLTDEEILDVVSAWRTRRPKSRRRPRPSR